jgi:hypothetical protein
MGGPQACWVGRGLTTPYSKGLLCYEILRVTAQDMDRWHALVNTVMNIQIS